MKRTVATPFLMAALYFGLSGVFHFLGGAIDQPHPVYDEGDWISHRMPDSFRWAEVISVVIFVMVCGDLVAQHLSNRARAKDLAFFPQFHKASEIFKRDASRWILIMGAAFLTLYWCVTVIDVWKWRQINSGWVWPPERSFVTCLLLWGLFWIADCLRRPHHTTIYAAIGFTGFIAILLPIIGTGVLRE